MVRLSIHARIFFPPRLQFADLCRVSVARSQGRLPAMDR